MALRKHFTDARGFESEAAYHRIASVSGNKDNALVTVDIFKDDKANTEPMGRMTFRFTPSGRDRWDQQAYTYLKTLPEYDGAEDC